jgi:hypothetical protein
LWIVQLSQAQPLIDFLYKFKLKRVLETQALVSHLVTLYMWMASGSLNRETSQYGLNLPWCLMHTLWVEIKVWMCMVGQLSPKGRFKPYYGEWLIIDESIPK